MALVELGTPHFQTNSSGSISGVKGCRQIGLIERKKILEAQQNAPDLCTFRLSFNTSIPGNWMSTALWTSSHWSGAVATAASLVQGAAPSRCCCGGCGSLKNTGPSAARTTSVTRRRHRRWRRRSRWRSRWRCRWRLEMTWMECHWKWRGVRFEWLRCRGPMEEKLGE